MAFDVKGLQRLSHLGTVGTLSPSLWLYATADTNATVVAANYFNAQVNYLKLNDVIMATTGVGGTPVCRLYVVTGLTATVVTITAVTGASWT